MDPADAFPEGWHETNVRAILQIQVLIAEVAQLEDELKSVEAENLRLVQLNDMLRNTNSRLRKQVTEAELGNCPHPFDRRATSFKAGVPETRCSVCGVVIPIKLEGTPIGRPAETRITKEQRAALVKALDDAAEEMRKPDTKKRWW